VGGRLAHRLAAGNKDITGDGFVDIFSGAVGGIRKQTPFGMADVIRDGCAWSLKAARRKKPRAAVGRSVRLISGRIPPPSRSASRIPGNTRRRRAPRRSRYGTRGQMRRRRSTTT